GVRFAVGHEERIASRLGSRIVRMTGGRDGASQRERLLLEEAVDGEKVLVNLRGPGACPVVIDQLEGQRLEGAARFTSKQPAPPGGRLLGQPAKSHHVGMGNRGEAPAPVPRYRMPDEVQKSHQREE